MKNNDKYKVAFLLGLLAILSLVVVFHARMQKNGMKGKVKELYSAVIVEQASTLTDSAKLNIERFHQIDSSGYTHDVKVMDFIIQDYKRLSYENKRLKDSLK